MNYRLYAVRVFVYDWDTAIRFYTETLGMEVAFRSDEMGWAQFATGEGQLALERVAPGEAESETLVGRFVGVSLQVDDLESVYDRLVGRGVHFVAPPESQPWGGVLAHFQDPEGNVLTLLGSE